jgi:hypothetical protein
MCHENIATGKVLSFPRHQQVIAPRGEDLIQKILVRTDNLLNGLKLLRNAYEAALADKSRRDVEEILVQVETLLKHPEKVNSPTQHISVRIRFETRLRIGLWAIARKMARLCAAQKEGTERSSENWIGSLICFAAHGAIRKADSQH